MRQANNGFTRFMCKIEGKPVIPLKKTSSRWTVGDLHSVEIIFLKYLERVREGCPGGNLLQAFVWSSTPHGHVHWWARDSGIEEMSDDDYAFCEALYEVHT